MSSILYRSENPVLVDIEILAKNAKTALFHERYIKETQQSNGNSNLEVLLSKRIPELKVIFDQLLVWFDELVSVYRINLGLPKKIRDAQPNLDVSSFEEKSETDTVRDLSNTVRIAEGMNTSEVFAIFDNIFHLYLMSCKFTQFPNLSALYVCNSPV